jgi:hypothetical protein
MLAVPNAAAIYRASGLVLWHFSDMPGRTANVRYWGSIGLNADIGIPLLTDAVEKGLEIVGEQ